MIFKQLRPLVGLLLMSWLASKPASAFENVNFNADVKSEIIKIPQDNCSSMIDDESNYEVVQIAPNRFKVTTKGINENSAMLLIDCGGQTYAFSLSFKNQPTENFDSKLYQESALRPPSYLASAYSSNPQGSNTLNLELFDGSYDAAQITTTRTYYGTHNPRDRKDSFDLFHHFARSDFGYGISRSYSALEIADEFRERLRLWSLSVNASETIVDKTIVARKYFLITPTPVAITYSYSQLRTRNVVHEAERSFFAGIGAATIYSRLSYQQSINEDSGQKSNRWEGSNSSVYKFSPIFAPGIDTGGYCQENDRCKSSSLYLLNESRLKSTAIDVKYGIFPHNATLRVSQHIYDKDELSLNINRSLKTQPWTEQQHWIDVATTTDSTRSNADLHIEYRHKEYYYFADHDLVLVDPAMDTSQRVLARVGMRFEGREWAYGTSLDFSYQRKTCCGFSADLHWYFDRNLRYGILAASRHKILGKVQSELTQEPIEDATVMLMKNGETIRQTTTSKTGQFEFSDAPQSGSLTLVVHSGVSELKKDIEKDITKLVLETDLLLQDYYLINVKFYNQDRPSEQIQNYMRETNDAIVAAPGAVYLENKIYVKKSGMVKLKLSPEFLPYGVELLDFKGQDQNTLSKEDGNVEIRLRSTRR